MVTGMRFNAQSEDLATAVALHADEKMRVAS
jgi:hypothetical protein